MQIPDLGCFFKEVRSYYIYILPRVVVAFVFLGLFYSCEEVIDLKVNDASPITVIEANISEGGPSFVRITQSSLLYEDARNNQIGEIAEVMVMRSDGAVISFVPVSEQGLYVPRDIQNIRTNFDYTLIVDVGGQRYTATDYMFDYIEVDSTGTGIRRIFDDDIYYGSFTFQDPAGQQNYYRYDAAVNNADYKFNAVVNDRFNDGLQVVHEILSPEENLTTGDVLRIRRSIISKQVYQYWNDIQSVNPGSVAPANPRSNISNGALGYFSANTSRMYEFPIRQPLPPDLDVDDDVTEN